MRKEPIIIALSFAALFASAYLAPIVVSNVKSQPLYGNFDMGNKCSGGHEIFLYLDEKTAYWHCPGHREMKPIGTMERYADAVTIYRKKDHSLWAKVTCQQGSHSITLTTKGTEDRLPQVNNPWRTALPKHLPE